MKRPFILATEAMMNALDVAAGMSSHELECFRFNTDHFIADMIKEAQVREAQAKYPMERHDWGRGERKQQSGNIK